MGVSLGQAVSSLSVSRFTHCTVYAANGVLHVISRFHELNVRRGTEADFQPENPRILPFAPAASHN
jgi:hypothetical protein